jgi:hypothetical protein
MNKNNSTYLRGGWTNFSVWAEFSPSEIGNYKTKSFNRQITIVPNVKGNFSYLVLSLPTWN